MKNICSTMQRKKLIAQITESEEEDSEENDMTPERED